MVTRETSPVSAVDFRVQLASKLIEANILEFAMYASPAIYFYMEVKFGSSKAYYGLDEQNAVRFVYGKPWRVIEEPHDGIMRVGNTVAPFGANLDSEVASKIDQLKTFVSSFHDYAPTLEITKVSEKKVDVSIRRFTVRFSHEGGKEGLRDMMRIIDEIEKNFPTHAAKPARSPGSITGTIRFDEPHSVEGMIP